MKITRLILLLILLAFTLECIAYRILAVYPFNGKSHNIVLEAVARTLANHGHQVDVITHFPLKKPVKNYNEIINLDGSMEILMNNYTIEFVSSLRGDVTTIIANQYGNRVCNFMGFESMQKLIKNPPKDPPYDLVIVEAFTANCYFGFGYVLKVPVVAISSALEYPWISDFIGNDDNPAYVPNTFYIKFGKLNYWDRVKNYIINTIERGKYHMITKESQTESMRKYLSPDIPDIREVEKNVALTLVNSNPIIFGVKPITPSLVQIAGLHIEANDETLSPELKKWMDESKDGVVYFSLGSMVLIETMSTEHLKEMYTEFEKIAPIRVLMKVVDKSKLPPGLPKNIKTSPWIPQIPVLAHPNVKAFITHGGLGGVLEALYYGVPMIGMPLFSDQFRNCEAFVVKKMMVTLEINEFSGKLLKSALQALLYDPIYKKNSLYYSKLFRDRPMSPGESAVYWIEYVIRNGPILRSPALDYKWWELDLLDVYALFLFVFLASLAASIFIIKLVFRTFIKVIGSKSRDKKKKIQ